MTTDDARRAQAARLKAERERRGWGVRRMARFLRDAVEDHQKPELPSFVTYVKRWESGTVEITDARYRAAYARVLDIPESDLFGPASAVEMPTFPRSPTNSGEREQLVPPLRGNLGAIESALDDPTRTIKGREVIAWVESTNTSEAVIDYINNATQGAAEDHVFLPPAVVLARVRHLQIMVNSLLRGGRQRLRQSRELLRLYADLSAHMCQLLGDVNQDQQASAYGDAAMVLADEAESNPSAAFSALAQMARWRHRHADAADLAAAGLKHHPSQNLRALLAYQEANAAAAAGQQHRAREAMSFAEAIDAHPESHSAWACPPPRRALYRIGIALNLGDPREALRQADEANSLFRGGFPQVAYGTWAHYQICVTNAHLILGSVDGAVEYIMPVLNLPSEYRLSTLISHIAAIDSLLQQPRFAGSSEAASIRTRLSRFAQS